MDPAFPPESSPYPDPPEILPAAPLQAGKRRPAPRGTAAYPRKRAVRACQVCRSRRTKCDNRKPSCSFCERIGAKCITSPVDLSSFDPASLRILERLDQLEDRLLPKDGSASYWSINHHEDVVPDELPHALVFHTVEDSITNVLSWPVFEGRFDSHLDLKSLLRTIPLDKATATTNIDLDSTSGFLLVESFLRHVHIKNPILDERKLHRMVNRVSLEGFGWDAESCLVLLVYALGSIASSFDNPSSPDSDSLARARSYFNASQRRIGAVLGTGAVLEAQCFFYSGVYLMSLLQPTHAWRHFIQALACCQEFEFATKSLGTGQVTPSDVYSGPPAEERLYWTCWKSELEVRQNLLLPDFTTKDHKYPRLFPTPPMDNSQEEHREWYFYLAEISLRRLETRIRNEVRYIRKPNNDLAYVELSELVPSYEDQVNIWIQSLPEMMSLQSPEADDDVLKFILRGHLMNYYEVIYWPFVEAIINQRQGFEAAKEYSAKGLQYCCERIRLNKPGFAHRHHGTWLMLQSCTRSALVLVAAVSGAVASELIPEDWRATVLDVIEMLKLWEHEAGDARNRLRILEEALESVDRASPLLSTSDRTAEEFTFLPNV